MTPSGDSGKRKHGATARGGGRGRCRGRSAGRGGRGGAGAVVPAVGVRSPGGGLPALQQAAGANATSGGGGEGRACVSAGGRPAGAISAGGGASPFQSLSNAPRGGVRQALLGLASTAFDSASSCAPENFQQSRLNGAMWQSDNHGHPLPPAPDQLAVLEDVQAPQRQKHTGPSKRRTSTRQRDARGGGQHVIQGGAAGAWGGQGGLLGVVACLATWWAFSVGVGFSCWRRYTLPAPRRTWIGGKVFLSNPNMGRTSKARVGETANEELGI